MVSYNEVLLAQVQQTAACNALHAAESSLARWLLQTRDRIDSDVLPLSQEFLSQMLGVRRTTMHLTIVHNRHYFDSPPARTGGRHSKSPGPGLKNLACECFVIVRDQMSAACLRLRTDSNVCVRN